MPESRRAGLGEGSAGALGAAACSWLPDTEDRLLEMPRNAQDI